MAMRLAMVPEITRQHARPLFECRGQRLLTQSLTVQLCKLSDTAIQAWSSTAQANAELLWQLDTTSLFIHEQNRAIKDWRLTPDNRLILQANHNGFIEVDVASGRVLSHRPDHGRFASHAQAHLLDMLSSRWLDFDDPNPCPAQIIQAHRLDDAQVYLCQGGSIYTQRHDGSSQMLYDGQAGEAHHYARVPRTGEHWVASSAGHLWPLHAFERRVALGAPVREIMLIPSTSYILVRDWSSTWRVLDTVQGDWIASFGSEVEDVRPTIDGTLQVIRQGYVEIWSLPHTSPIRRYRAEHGLADVAWSLDGSTLAAGDGGSHVHWFKPFLGRRIEPLHLGAAGVVKSVTPLYEGGFAASTSLLIGDGEGMARIIELDGRLKHIELVPTGPWRPVARRVESISDGTLALVTIGKSFGRFSPDPRGDGTYVSVPEHTSMTPGFLDLDTDQTRTHALVVGRDTLAFIGPEDTLGMLDAPQGATFGAIAQDGRYALATPEGIWLHDRYASLQGHITTHARVTSMDWRSGAHHLITGHLDGTINIWRTDTGEQLASIHHHQGRVSSVASSPDGQHLASASWDTTVRVLNLDVLDHLQAP